MFKCKSCKDTGKITLFSTSKSCLDCPAGECPAYDELVEILEHGTEVILAHCSYCGWTVDVHPETMGYNDLKRKGSCLALCPTCNIAGRKFTRI